MPCMPAVTNYINILFQEEAAAFLMSVWIVQGHFVGHYFSGGFFILQMCENEKDRKFLKRVKVDAFL